MNDERVEGEPGRDPEDGGCGERRRGEERCERAGEPHSNPQAGNSPEERMRDREQRALLRGSPPKIIWLRVGNNSTAAVAALLRTRRKEILAFDADPSASFLALS